MARSRPRRAPRRLLVFLAIGTVLPAAALAWLSWRILDQDRALERQRVRDALERSADLTAAAVTRKLSDIEERLPALWDGADASFPQDAAVAAIDPPNVDARPAGRILYWPVAATSEEPPGDLWTAGEAFEFHDRNSLKALAAFRQLARSHDQPVRAGALIRIGRILRKLRRFDEALGIYAEVEQIGGVSVLGTPADLLAYEARCAVFQEVGRVEDAGKTASAIRADLMSGRWRLDRVGYEFHIQEAQRLGGRSARQPAVASAMARAEALDWLWQQRSAIERHELPSSGLRSLWIDGAPMLVVWRVTAGKILAFVAGQQYLQTEWRNLWPGRGTIVTLTDPDGHAVLGPPAGASAPQAVRAAADTNLPWTLRISSADPNASTADTRARRQLLLAGLGILTFIVLTAVYAALRAASREMAVARLQSDFVSAVSHEFRTPLTSMRHLTELLRDDVVRDEPRRRQYYNVLARETERLQRLVEGLLDFGRMEAGAHEYRFESVDPLSLVDDVVQEFGEKLTGAEARAITFAHNGNVPSVQADREAVGRALWNLLDNAVKYSPAGAPVRVELASSDQEVAIRVIDRGPGIAPGEQRDIFQKFVRGAGSKALNIKGTGLGLAMVQHIISAHGGSVRLESEMGKGSTFTLALPH